MIIFKDYTNIIHDIIFNQKHTSNNINQRCKNHNLEYDNILSLCKDHMKIIYDIIFKQKHTSNNVCKKH